jgi:hypothetical protein
VRRSIDDYPFTTADLPPSDDELQQLSWAVAISDDYDDAEPRVVLTVEEVGSPGEGLSHTHRRPRPRLRVALRGASARSANSPGD